MWGVANANFPFPVRWPAMCGSECRFKRSGGQRMGGAVSYKRLSAHDAGAEGVSRNRVEKKNGILRPTLRKYLSWRCRLKDAAVCPHRHWSFERQLPLIGDPASPPPPPRTPPGPRAPSAVFFPVSGGPGDTASVFLARLCATVFHLFPTF